MPEITLAEYARRRRRVRTALKKAIGVVFAGPHHDPLHQDYRPHPHFEYLTGVVDEPGAILVLDPGNPVEARREALFLEPLDPEMERWDGYRLEIGSKLRERTGIKTIFRLGQLGRFLNDSARRADTLACLHPLAQFDQPVSPDMELFRKIAERVPGMQIVDRSEVAAKLRSVKSPAEVRMIQQAIDITACGFEAAMQAVRPGMNEFELQETIEHAYRSNGARGPAFGTIAAAGRNSTVLHYRANDQEIAEGDMVCIDSGAGYGGYGGDITRTIPANGVFTDRQKEIYQIVLKAQNAAIKTARPGVRIAELDKLARAVISKSGHGDHFIHGIGHHLGLETHDITPDGPLQPGAVITVEPGIYIPEENLGVRIEDNILITKEGARNLSARIPKTVAAVEKAMGKGRH